MGSGKSIDRVRVVKSDILFGEFDCQRSRVGNMWFERGDWDLPDLGSFPES